jgi:serine/threonine protein kinase
MHRNKFFHRDLKPENILLQKYDHNPNQNGIHVKISDLGSVKESTSTGPMTEYVSTRWYRSPECLLRFTQYGSAMDIWSLGCIIAELYLLSPLFPGQTELD